MSGPPLLTRAELITRMAADLRRLEATGSERDAICALMGSDSGYRYGDIAMLAEDALFEARQAAVAETVAKP